MLNVINFLFIIFTLLQTNGEHHEKTNGEAPENEEEIDPQFEPIVSLPLIEVSNNEEDEVEMLKL